MKFLFCFFCLCTATIDSFAQKTVAQQNDITHHRPPDFEYLSASDSNGAQSLLKSPSLDRTQQIKLPYPILFVHGLGSKSSTWDSTTNFMDSQYGFTYGGRFDFCLNFDGNNTTTNKNFYPAAGADLALFTPNLIAGDYYYVNFSVGSDGSVYPTSSDAGYVLSEQQAIVKQGAALSRAIYKVLQKTGRDKIILMGHSMGGLASREYIQNPGNWQSDGEHHVAKLVTTGTPHGGSNSTSCGLPVSDVDEQSEAMRDLRRTYYYSNDSGVYLYGGLEFQDNNLHMDDNSTYSGIDFYNVDVNCNGITGENIIGLNHKSISSDLDFACIIGECDGCLDGTDPSDGVVRSDCANLKNYYNLNVNQVFNLFYFNSSGTVEIHTDLPMQNYQNMQGLDEPNEYVLAYHIDFDTLYSGFITVQPAGGYPYDYDDFKFSVSEPSKLSISISNINLLDLVARIIDATGNVVGSIVHSDGGATINFSQEVNAGDYFLEIYGVPTSISYLSPYTFKVQKTSVVSVTENSGNAGKITLYPNPVKNQFTIDIEDPAEILNVEILNLLGQIVYRSTFLNTKTIINTSQFPEGVYIIKFDSDKSRTIRKFVKE